MKINFLESNSILKKFLIFNFLAFSFMGIFTILYLNAIQLFKARTYLQYDLHKDKAVGNPFPQNRPCSEVLEKAA